ncbi:MAG: MFS transporter [Cytophagales bacterium]|nr:MFS transporter [Cytophagales bacterium]HMR56135.1 MFS transporter [Cyclobacteriaceae bacterium]
MNKTALVPNEKISAYHCLLFTVCFLGNILAGMASTLMSVYMPVVVAELVGAVNDSELNNVSAYINALYFVGWAIGGLTWGVIGDRIGRSKSLALAVTMYGLFTFLKSLAPSWEWILFFQFFCGFGVGGVLVLNTTLLSEVWPEKTRAVFIGILSTGFPVGIFSSGLVNYFVSGWREGFMAGVLPVGLGLLSFWLLKESDRWKGTRGAVRQQVSIGEYKADLFNGAVIFGSMLIGLWAIFSWLPTWVQTLLTNSDGQDERGVSMMLLGAGGLTGGFLSGWVANALGTRRAMILCFSTCFILSLLLFKGNSAFTTLTQIEIGLLALSFGISQGLLAVYIPLLFPVNIRATATGFCFNIGRFFTAAAVFFVGALVTTLGGYGNSLFAFSLIFIVGLLFIIFSRKQ